MALPGYLSTATLTFGPYYDLAGNPAYVGMQGKLTLSQPMVDSIGGGTIDPLILVTIGSDGTATVGPVVANDDPAINQGTTYRMEWQALSYKPTPGNKTFAILRASGSTVDYDTIANADGTATPGVPPQLPLVTSVAGRSGAITLVKGDVGLGNVDNTSDANKPVSTAQQAALGLSVASTASANATLAVNKHTPVDATAAVRTMTLPTGQAEGTRIIVEKVDASTNAVTISGSIRGSAGTEKLVGQYEAMSFLADSAGSWHPGPSHKTKVWLDSVYGYRYQAGASFGRGLKTALTPLCVQLLGDSTADGTGEWFDLFMRWLAPQFPAYTVDYRLWNDTLQCYSLPTFIQTGAAGDRWIRNSDNTTYWTAPDSAQTSPVGDIDIRVKAALDTWTPAAAIPLAGKFGGAGLRSWRIEINTNGTIQLGISSDGTNTPGAASTLPVPFTAGQAGWVRVTLDVDNGAGGNTATFYTSTDGSTWTQLGATAAAGGGTTSIFDSTIATEFMGRGGGGNTTPVTYYHLQVLSGLGAAAVPIIDFDLDVLPFGGSGAQTVTDHTGNIWTLAGSTETRGGSPGLSFMNGSLGGTDVGYASDSIRFPKLTPRTANLVFISYSHNGGAIIGSAYRASYKALTDLLVAKWPDAGIVTTSQNPRIAPAGTINDHAIRGQVISAFAASQGWPFLDIQKAFNDTGVVSTLINSGDGIHPTSAGSQVWAGVVETLFRPWLA